MHEWREPAFEARGDARLAAQSRDDNRWQMSGTRQSPAGPLPILISMRGSPARSSPQVGAGGSPIDDRRNVGERGQATSSRETTARSTALRAAGKAKSPADYRDLLRAGRWFRGTPEPFQDALVRMSRVRRVAGQQLVYPASRSPGAEVCDLFAVVAGKVRVGRRAGDGREMVITVVEPPSWMGEVALFDGPHPYAFTAEVDTVVVEVPTVPLLALLETEPRYWRELGRLVAAKLRLALLGMEDAATATIRERVAHRVLLMAEGYGEWTDQAYTLVKVSQETLAAMLSSSRQSVNAALRSLEADGIVRQGYGGIEIKDFDALRGAGFLDAARDGRAPRG